MPLVPRIAEAEGLEGWMVRWTFPGWEGITRGLGGSDCKGQGAR